MFRFLVRRLAIGALVIAAVSFLSWLIFATALNPLWVFWAEPKSPDALAAATRGHIHEPVLVRYWLWLRGLFTGQGFGHTVVQNTPVWPTIEPALWRTLQLVGASLVLVVISSVLIATVSVRRRGSPLDVGLRTVSYVSWAMPAFLVALLLQQGGNALAKHWHGYPLAIAGAPTVGLSLSWHVVTNWLAHMTLPVIAVAVGFGGAYSRYLRSSLLTTLALPYATVAQAKGLSEAQVIRRHALRNALVPFTAAIALDFGTVFTATLAADYVFGLGGLASVFLNGAFAGDPFVIEAEVIVAAAIVVVAGIIGELVCGWLDPRTRLA